MSAVLLDMSPNNFADMQEI